MGVQESHDTVNETLDILWRMSDDKVEYALTKLKEVASSGMQIQISKWDLIIFTQLTSINVKKIMQMHTNEKDPNTVNIHHIVASLVLSRSKWTEAQRIKVLIESVSYFENGNELSESEVQYLFHLIYHQINVVTKYEMKTSVLEQRTIENVFAGSKGTIDELVKFVSSNQECIKMLKLFTKTPILNAQKPIRLKESASGELFAPKKQHMTHGKNDTSFASDSSLDQQIEASPVNELEIRVGGDQQKRTLSPTQTENSRKSALKSPTEASTKSPVKMHGKNAVAQQQLHWNTYVLPEIGQGSQAYPDSDDEEKEAVTKNLHKDLDKSKVYQKMCEQLSRLRSESNSKLDFEDVMNTRDVSEQLTKIQNSALDFTGQRQLYLYMRSVFFEMQLNTSDFQIPECIGQGQLHEPTAEDVEFEAVMVRHQLAVTFNNFFKQHLPELRYEMKTHEARLVKNMMQRSKKCEIEKTKNQILGEIRVLCDILDDAEEYLKYRDKNLEKKRLQEKKTDESFIDGLHRAIPVQLQEKISYTIEQEEEREDNRQMISERAKQAHLAETREFPPNINMVFTKVHIEYNKIRNCCFGRKDILLYLDLKRQKQESKRIIGFFRGVEKALHYSCQLGTFADLDYFDGAQRFVDRALQRESRTYNQILEQHREQKRAFLDYNQQIGKLKALSFFASVLKEPKRDQTAPGSPQSRYFASGGSPQSKYFAGESQTSPREDQEEAKQDLKVKTFVEEVTLKLSMLTRQMEALDVELVQMTPDNILQQRSSKLYFKAYGQICTHKCISRALDFVHIVNYLKLGLTKIRTWESMALTCQEGADQAPKIDESQRSKSETRILKTNLIVSHLLALDERFQQNSPEDQEHSQFLDDIEDAIALEQTKAKDPVEMPRMDTKFKPVFVKQSYRKCVDTVLSSFYSRVCRKEAAEKLLKNFGTFCKSNLSSQQTKSKSEYEVQGELKFNSYSLEDAANSFFDFIEIEEQTDLFTKEDFIQEAGDTIAHWMGTLSCSMRQFNLQGKCKNVRKSYSEAHKLCSRYLSEVLKGKTTDKNFLDVHREESINHLIDYVNQLIESNSGMLINNMNILSLALPLEHSPTVNFKTMTAIQIMLKELELNQLVKFHLNSTPEMVSKRSAHFFRPSWAQSLILGSLQQACYLSELKLKNPEQAIREKLEATMNLEGVIEKTRKMLFGQFSKILQDMDERQKIELDECAIVKTESEKRPQATVIIDEDGMISDENENRDILSPSSIEPKKTITIHDTTDDLDTLRQTLKSRSQDAGGLGEIADLIENYENERNLKFRIKRKQLFTQMVDGAVDFMQKMDKQWHPNSTLIQKVISYLDQIKNHPNLGGHASDTMLAVSGIVGCNQKTCEKNIKQHIVRTNFLYKLIAQSKKNSQIQEFTQEINQLISEKEAFCKRIAVTQKFLKDNFEPKVQKKQDLKGARIALQTLTGRQNVDIYMYNPVPEKNISQKDSEEKLNKDISQGMLPSEHEANPARLTSEQVAANFLIQFIASCHKVEDNLASKYALDMDNLFTFMNLLRVDVDQLKNQVVLAEHLKKSYDHLFDIFQIEKGNLADYQYRFERIGKFISRDLQVDLEELDEGHIKFQFFTVMSQKGSALLKQLTNNLDWFYSLAEFDHHDKKQFNETFSALKLVVDTNLSTFKKFIDLEDSKKVASSHSSRIEFKTLRILQEVACMVSLLRIYYMKKEQARGLVSSSDFVQKESDVKNMSVTELKLDKSEMSRSLSVQID